MNFYTTKLCRPPARIVFLRTMKLFVLLFTISIFHANAATFAQQVTLNVEKAPLAQVFREIRTQTGYDFFYTNNLLNRSKPVSIHVKNRDLKEVLNQCLSDQSLTFSIENNIIVVRAAKREEPRKVPSKAIVGKVVDEGNKPIPGATIVLKGNPKVATFSNEKGEFVISVPDDQAVLVASYVGFATQELAVKSLKSPAIIVLRASVGDLNEIQITAYGTTTKRFNAGNITTITSEEIAKHPVNNVMEALQGSVPGLFIQQTTGQVGGAFNVRMRGSANFSTGATQPLVIVDGVRYPAGTLPLSKNTLYATENFLQGGSGLNYINPNDIESINVLKDIDATAIYGSAGAYGVILITTKKATSNTSALNANVYTGLSVNGKVPTMLNTEQYLTLRREALANDGITKIPGTDKDVNGEWPADRYTDWYEEFLGSAAATTNANVSLSGGAKNVSYLIGGSIRDVGNIQRHKGKNQDGTLRFSLNTVSNNQKFELSFGASYMASKNNMVPFDFTNIGTMAPNAPNPFHSDGSLNWDAIGNDLVISTRAPNFERLYSNNTNNLLANATATYKPIKKLTLRSIFGYNQLTGRELAGYPTTVFNPSNTTAPSKTVSILHQSETRSLTASPYAQFKTELGAKGDLTLTAGGEIVNTFRSASEITGTGFASDALLNDPTSASAVSTDYNRTDYRSIGMYGIIKYIWNERYILDINTRRDGSTKFGPGKRFGNFGSLAAAWIFSEETFFKDHVKFLSYGKLRGSTGTVGGDAVGNDFGYLSTYTVITGNYDGKGGLVPSRLFNPTLSWERNRNSEIALELGFFHDRLRVDANYYQNRASNQLISQSLATVTGFKGYAMNSDAVIRNNGYEFSFTSANIKAKDFSWTTRFNVTIPKSKVLRLPTLSNPENHYLLNQPVTGVRVYKYNGVNPETGFYSFSNAKGETADYFYQLGWADRTEFIDLAPKYYGGFTNMFNYRRLSLDFTFNFTSRTAKSFLGQSGSTIGPYGQNGSVDWLRRWQKPGDITDIPKLSTDLANSSFRQMALQESTGAYSDATYARLQNVSLRYAFNQEHVRRIGLKGLSLYLQGQNLLTISKFGGLDPESLSGGVIPPLRVFTAGFNITL